VAKGSAFLVQAIRLVCEVERGANYLLHALGCRRRYYSQKGQDRWLIERVFHKRTGGYFVDVGAGDGRTHSNTYVLEKDYGWTGVLIDANPAYVGPLKEYRRSPSVLACVDRESRDVSFLCLGYMSGIVADDTDHASKKRRHLLLKHAQKITFMRSQPLANILDSIGAPPQIQYLSIDVEGAELRILSEFPFDRYSFDAITIERPTSAVHGCLSKAGYILVDLRWCDGFYVNSHVATQLNLAPCKFEGMASKFF
jgi:hypothetical protein